MFKQLLTLHKITPTSDATLQYQIIELSAYAYLNNKTFESILRKKIYYQILNMTPQRQNYRFYNLSLGSVCLDFFGETFFMYARPLPVQTKVHFKNLLLRAVAYDLGLLSCASDVVLTAVLFFS